MTALLARINSRLDEIEAGPAVAAVAVFLLASLAALIFGSQAVLNVVFVVAGALLIWNAGIGHSRQDEALDNADKAHGRIEAVESHLSGLETPGAGRHARRAA